VVSVADVMMNEGNAGVTNFVFTFTLDQTSSSSCVFGVENFDGTATPGTDFVAFNQQVTIPAGMLQSTLTVQVSGDTDVEMDETFGVDVFGEPGACDIAAAAPTGTIINDDVANIELSIAAASAIEGNGGTATLLLPVTLSAPAPVAVNIPFTVTAGTAIAGVDYQTTAGDVVIAAGATSGSAMIGVIGDLLDENDETLTVTIGPAPAGYVIVNAAATGTITDDDAAPTISVSSPSVNEGNAGSTALTFVVSLSAPSGLDVTFMRATANGTATAGSDYTALASALATIPAGQTSLNVVVQVTGDVIFEPSETFVLNLTGITNASPAAASGMGTIVNDDAVPAPPMLIPAGDARGLALLAVLLSLFSALALRRRAG
jgi:hypothetical protein